ncbi:hypothetical protein OHB12_26585 [Nocardia sp. NBC_01730]|uniref:hypothetical protein n=1 Tax=Nocardia sp. NBC_01730 TaxID=2975998 RepID=UPI002E12FA40|nr:hypothetical protein OHB12_26585 [Nocardia sp. NBC_01730]
MDDCERGPWILWSHCGFGKFDPHTNALVEVACPSRFCAVWVRLVDGKLADHERTDGGPCPWIGVRVVDDRTDPSKPNELIYTEALEWVRDQ